MSDNKPDKDFWDRADEIIDLANKQCDSASNGKVSSSLLYAAARFNAFIVASSAKDSEELKNDKERAVKYFTEQYKKMLVENIDEHIKNYEKNIEKQRNS
ncbi:DUF3144 domain-containing protein [Methylobacter marinus]|jgi:hypothetical protein|uniref:DUF3144 domain-containing protein n=1 Tax=Methylobacter marinus TaxID=34058 RepID=UPI00036648B4|nr:DUF3144 domain-containing protein [Methylobacter marinus]